MNLFNKINNKKSIKKYITVNKDKTDKKEENLELRSPKIENKLENLEIISEKVGTYFY